MNNDLISRESLKDYARTVLCEDSVTNASLIRIVDEIIDNAPTVSTEDCEGCPYCPNSNSGIPIGVE